MADFFSRFRRTAADTKDAADPARAAFAAEPTAQELLALWLARDDDVERAWSTARPGPGLDEIGRRLSSVPKAFLDDDVDLEALVGDVLDDVFPDPFVDAPAVWAAREVADVVRRIADGRSLRARRGAALALWLWASESQLGTTQPPLGHTYAARAVAAFAWRLAPSVDPADWLSDTERRDEAARTFLLWSGYLPAGEDAPAARELFAMHDSLQHDRALAAALGEHQHRLEVTNRLQEARAREAAQRSASE